MTSTLLSPRYESTSSEEDEEEEDGSSSDESGEGECLDSTEDEAALEEEETSEEERNVNIDESDTDEETLRDATYSSDVVKEKCVLSAHMLFWTRAWRRAALSLTAGNASFVSGLSSAQKCGKPVSS